MSLALRYRVPNPPLRFVGRTGELATLEQALDAAPLHVLHGGEGFGKSALAYRYVQGREARALRVRVDRASAAHVHLDLARALASETGLVDVDWGAVAASAEGRVAMVLDLAEAAGAIVLIEDLHELPPEDADELLTRIVEQARVGRFLVTTRRAPRSALLDGLAQEIRELDRDAMIELAAHFAPGSPDAATRLADEARGSPRALRDLAFRAKTRSSSAIDTLGDAARQLLECFAILPRTFAGLRVSSLMPAERDLASELARSGLAETDGAVVRASDEARRSAIETLSPERLRAARRLAIARLAEVSDPVETIARIAIELAVGDLGAARASIERGYDVLLAEGFSVELWELLRDRFETELESVRLRCGTDLGTPEAMQLLEEPRSPAIADRVRWARACVLRSEHARAVEAIDALDPVALAEAPPEVVVDAVLVRAAALGNMGRFTEALAALEPGSLPPVLTLTVDSFRASLIAAMGDEPRALAIARSIVPQLPSLSAYDARRARRYLVATFNRGHAPIEARALLADWDPPYTFHGLQGLLMRADVALELGLLAEAEATLVRLLETCGASDFLTPYARGLRCEVEFVRGHLDGLDGAFEASRADGERRRSTEIAAHAIWFLGRLARDRGELDATPLLRPDASPRWRARIELEAARHHIRAGIDVPCPAPIAAPSNAVVAAGAIADWHSARGEHAHSIAVLEEAAANAGRHGYRAHQAEALAQHGLALLAAGRVDAARVSIEHLASLATAIGSDRLDVELRWLSWLGSARREPAALETLARATASPRVARFARKLLGDGVQLDVVDARLLDAITAALDLPHVVALDGTGIAWGIDFVDANVWREDGATIDLSEHAIAMRMLDVLVESGGGATKERLVERVWGEREYHPLRHDNRLRVAIRKLRAAIEPAQEPALLLTDADGYRLGGRTRVRKPRQTQG